MKKIFGLDLGVASIGWAIISQSAENENNTEIIDCGVRIVPLDSKETDEFKKGGSVPTNHARRMARGMRRNNQRFKLRRAALIRALKRLDMMPDDDLLHKLSPSALFSLRDRALAEPLTLKETGRVFLLLNLRRGFKSSRKTEKNDDQSQYKEAISQREAELREKNQTIGQRLATGLLESKDYRVKQQIFNRHTYVEEFDMIWIEQAKYHPLVFTEENRRLVRDKIIYHQRPLKSAKSLVGECALEWNFAINKETKQPIILPNGLKKITRPKSAPKSSPLAQECNIWESIHNLRVHGADGSEFRITDEHKRQIFNVLQQEEKGITSTRLIRDILKISPKDYKLDNLTNEKGLEGNRTRGKLLKIFKDTGISRLDLLDFNPNTEVIEWTNPDTGEIITRSQICSDFDQQPLYQLWHLIYATQEEKDLQRLLQERYGFNSDQAKAVAAIDFTSAGYAGKSHRAMRRLLPHYRSGLDYTNACKAAGYNHSNSLTKNENQARMLLTQMDPLPKNSLRNPVVEKILNQMIHLVNELIVHYGSPDEICIEMARELRQSAKERQETTIQIAKREKENKRCRQQIAELLNIDPASVTKVQIEKWKLGEETGWISLYTGSRIDCATFMLGEQIDIEHIIPKVRRFDDSFLNKTFCESKINQQKGDLTAHDFMKLQPVAGLQSYDAYIKMINHLLSQRSISIGKYKNLMLSAEEILDDGKFLARQLRETQFITSKARTLLMDVCYNVRTTTGSVTDFLRHQWGWDEIIHNSRINQFRLIGKTKIIKIQKGTQTKEVIQGWSKRDDHRHHALDALVTACTSQSHIFRINNLNQILDGKQGSERRSTLLQAGRDKYIAGAAPFSYSKVMDALEHVLVSFKQKNKVATRSRNRLKKNPNVVQSTLTPRGAFHKETIYGVIKQYGQPKPLNGKFKLEWVDKIAHPHQRSLIEARLAEFNGDPRKAFKDLEKHPILYGKDQLKKLTKVTLWDEFFVARESIGTQTSANKIEKIADVAVKNAVRQRLQEGGGDPKKAFDRLGENPVKIGNLPVYSVRVLNPAEKMIRLPRGYAKSDGNHHIAIYQDETGKRFEHVVSFWDAFQRAQIGIPVIIESVAAVYDTIANSIGQTPDDLHLPENPDWQFVTSLAINDMFIFDLDLPESELKNPENRKQISSHLFKVRKLTAGSYWFLHHRETEILEDTDSKKVGRCKQCSISSLKGAIKIKLNRLGHITQVFGKI